MTEAKQRVRDLVAEVHAPDGPDVVPLQDAPEHRPGDQEDEGDLDGQLGVQVPFLPVEAVLLQHHDHGEAQAAEEHAEHERDEDPQISLVGDDAVGMRRETGVVEGRDRSRRRRARRTGRSSRPRVRKRGIIASARAASITTDVTMTIRSSVPTSPRRPAFMASWAISLPRTPSLLLTMSASSDARVRVPRPPTKMPTRMTSWPKKDQCDGRGNHRQAGDADGGHRSEEGLVQGCGLSRRRRPAAGTAGAVKTRITTANAVSARRAGELLAMLSMKSRRRVKIHRPSRSGSAGMPADRARGPRLALRHVWLVLG